MKKKIVLWGTNASDERILVALELVPQTNKVNVYTFPESVATEEFYNQMLNVWRLDQEVVFPENYSTIERELTVSDGLLPDDIKVERGDIVQRAQTEWHFIVLSSKLNEVYQAELNELKEKIDQLSSFDNKVWDSLKAFWSKVQGQVQERNLFREHANSLRDSTNALFARLKELRSALDEEFKKLSEQHLHKFHDALEEMENKIKEGVNLTGIFEDLKKMQADFRQTKFTKDHRTKVWNRLDKAFKLVKEKRFGPQEGGGDSSPLERLTRRYKGLLAAIEKMEKSINRDKQDMAYQNSQIAKSEGQLEMQIRQAKNKMIEERIRSKEEKLGEMHKTREELERRLEVQKQKEAKKAEKAEIEKAREEAKKKIAEEIKNAEESRVQQTDELKKAAAALSQEPAAKSEDSLVDAISTTMGEALDDVVDTIKAVAEVVGTKVDEVVQEIKEEMKEEEASPENKNEEE